jgi:putative Mg2+ transporter-C (MgtC) family protein
MTLSEIFWSPAMLSTNGLILLDILGAMGLGLILGFERNFHGHAAGMRTYALVCGATAGLVAIGGFSGQWFGGPALTHGPVVAEATHVIQGIVTGIGFLGAGMIMRDGATIRGLSTAASIWAAAAIGIIVGVGFYAAALAATLLMVVLMSGFKRLEMGLPHRRQIKVAIRLDGPAPLTPETLPGFMKDFGYTVVETALTSAALEKHFSYDLVLQADAAHNFNDLADALGKMQGVAAFSLTPMRD